MRRTKRSTGYSQELESGRALWSRCRSADAMMDEGARFLDLAAFADELLDQEECDRVAVILAADPTVAADVAAARATADGRPAPSYGLDSIIARAMALVPEAALGSGLMQPLHPAPASRRLWHGVAQWGSLAAALAVASWLGFTMGSGVSLELSQPVQQSQVGVDSLLPELLDPASGFLRDLGEGQQT